MSDYKIETVGDLHGRGFEYLQVVHVAEIEAMEDKLTTAQAENESLRARVAELEVQLAKWKGKRIVYGVGICDADYTIGRQETINGKAKQVWVCPFYRTWRNMIARCYRKREHDHRPGYKGCTVAPEWHRFSSFKKWMDQQDWQGKHLDKEILAPGNKVYSPDTCTFVTQELNSFLIDRSAKRGAYPIGVSWHKGARKFKAQCRDPFLNKQIALGFFDDPSEAHECWRKYKHNLACRYAETVSDSRVADALRSRYAQSLRQQAAEIEKGITK